MIKKEKLILLINCQLYLFTNIYKIFSPKSNKFDVLVVVQKSKFLKSNKIYLLWALLCVIGLLSNTDVFAQAKTPKQIADSTRNVILQERKTRDSITAINKINLQKEIAERHRIADSTKASRIAFRDSVTASRAAIKKEKDAIAKVKNSKKYIKEQEKIKQNRIDSIAYVRAKKADLIKKERKKLAEEIAIQRIAKVESMAKQRKQTADSLAEWRKENLAKIKENRTSSRFNR